MRKLAEGLRSLTAAHNWEGTVEELSIVLSKAGAGTMSAAQLGIWLRRHEPALWWDYALSAQFTRTGRSRLVYLCRRRSHNRVKAFASDWRSSPKLLTWLPAVGHVRNY